ncbi:MAG: ribonuclease P protein component [Candidatus Taylorbacteria bacterium RIFCSPHIGHO2_02_FULL_44_36]|uniref:Ribonuclease P protein component n=1 Tax=Candidatus Taylorbacteria bacterium RIFCSPLOWO2_12_FULL_44_15c TaxID=1802333 RepID=A0A1G2P6Q6_9BACT|nr:MAG: ribonuclease P protein component [Candidatus Taylorbacteria bacterium RIFCSPHIGHO2_02_FULL_44_36]OHA38352.1 MAG: ribonuclease P protein component [Candidatus Taylorbacteria bacterium RIFCSPLOWO2_02_FULL_44_35]OHA44017.1 MAG: ribonuclease P protein component [Candidatus Taylorbacteria bacterium RIFCSPLOWO2_12_FULL_44_15c]
MELGNYNHVVYLSSKKTKTRQDPRLSFPPKDLWWSPGDSRAPAQGPKKTFNLAVVFMLPKKQRVSRKLFEAVFRSATTFSSPFFVLKIKKEEASRFAFSVSVKICPKAVDRNKLRRRGYAAARNLLPEIKIPTICLFIIKKGAEKLTFQKLQEEIKNILQKAGIV